MKLEILQAIQSISHPALDVLFTLFTLFGEKMVLAGIFCAVYWCFDKQMGRYLMLALCASLCLNGILKDTFQFARPIGESGIVSKWVDTATGHSFPSGHAQSSATFWWGAALWLKKRWVKASALLLILGVAFSRLYLGVHYPADVLVGMILGILVSTLIYQLLQKGRQLPVYLLCGLLAVVSLMMGSSKDTLSAGVMTLCVFAGMRFEEQFVHFKDTKSPGRKMVRLVLGGMILGTLYFIPALLLPGSVAADIASIGIIAFAAMGLYPWLLVKIRI